MTIWIGIDKSIMYNRIKDPLSSCHQSQAHRAHTNLVAPPPYKCLPGTPTGTRASRTTSSTTTVRRSTASRCGTGTGRALPGTIRPALSKPSSSVKPRPAARFLCFVQTEHAKVLFLWDIAHLLSLVNSLVTPILIMNIVQLNQLNILY